MQINSVGGTAVQQGVESGAAKSAAESTNTSSTETAKLTDYSDQVTLSAEAIRLSNADTGVSEVNTGGTGIEPPSNETDTGGTGIEPPATEADTGGTGIEPPVAKAMTGGTGIEPPAAGGK